MKPDRHEIWPYQHVFQFGLTNFVRELFQELSPQLTPQLFLLGVLRENDPDRPAICLEPEDCGLDPEALGAARDLAATLYARHPDRHFIITDDSAYERYHKTLRLECLRRAVTELIDAQCRARGRVSFVAHPVAVGLYNVFIVLQCGQAPLEQSASLTRDEVQLTPLRKAKVHTSLTDAVISIFLREAAEALYRPDPGLGPNVVRADRRELLRLAGARFINTAILAARLEHATPDAGQFFDICNYISSLKYEGISGTGKLIIARPDHANVRLLMRLTAPVPLKDYRNVRKLLEITSEDVHLSTDGNSILGIAELAGAYDPVEENLFIVNFIEAHKWELLHGDQTLMVVEYTSPRLPKPPLDKTRFESTLARVFPGITPDAVNVLWRLVTSAIDQKHGTLVVISSDAAGEAARLQHQSTRVAPVAPGARLTRRITSIDGAVLFDPSGLCHAIGAILDGKATDNGAPARGARFNSAIRYIDTSPGRAVAVIVSEDGMVDLYPDLRPQIRRAEISGRLDALRSAVAADTPDFDTFKNLLDWFDAHRFYLGHDSCIEANRLRDAFYAKHKNETRVLFLRYEDFVQNLEMDDSYFTE